MPIFLFADVARSTLAAPISSLATSITLAPGDGAKFPSPGAGQQFALVLNDAATRLVYEIVYCTARTVDVLTVARAQEGTTALPWAIGDFAYNGPTAGQMNAMVQIPHMTDASISPIFQNGTFAGSLSVNGVSTFNGIIESPGTSLVELGTFNNLNPNFAKLSVENPSGNAAQFMFSGAFAGSSVMVQKNRTDGSLIEFRFSGTPVGEITTDGSNVFYTTVSDYRLKISYGLAVTDAIIDAVPVHDAAFNAAPDARRPMFIAHELAAAMPSAVMGEKDATRPIGDLAGPVDPKTGERSLMHNQDQPGLLPPGYQWRQTGVRIIPQQIDTAQLVPVLWAEVQALRKRVAELERKP